MVNEHTKKIYADHSATTKPRKEVVDTMQDVLENCFGNPSSIHGTGRRSRLLLENSREKVAKVLNALPEEIFFTSGGTESDNAAIFGVSRLVESRKLKKEKHIVTTKIEHHAVREPLLYLEKQGWQITWLNVDKEGFVDVDELKSSLTKNTALVSVIHANNEIGTIQDIKRIGLLCREKEVLFHSDIVQSFGKVPVDLNDIPADLLSISSHKIYGPKGVGAVFVRSNLNLSPLIFGGGQEKGRRSGTENLSGIAGFATAACCIDKELSDVSARLRKFQIKIIEELNKIADIIITGCGLDKISENLPFEKYLYRLPGHVSLCIKGLEAEALVLQSDMRGIACSSGSACLTTDEKIKEAHIEPSHVLKALNIPPDFISGSLRITLGRENSEDDADYIAASVKDIIGQFSKDNVETRHGVSLL